MIAARIHRTGGPEVFELDQVEDPVPGAGEILVRVRATSVNHRDIWIRKGHPHPKYRVEMPAILGIDLCGDVVAIGAGVDGFVAGGRVTVSPYLACGSCEACRRSHPQYCMDFDVYHGTYAELAIVPAAAALNVSREVPEEALACFSNSYITAWQMLVGKCHVGPDDVVFVWGGTSGLGSAAVEIALLSGARVIASAGKDEKLALLEGRGPELVLDHRRPDLVAKVLEATGGRGVTIVVEHVGQATWQRSMDMCASGATIVTAGATSGDDASFDVTALFVKQLRILGSRLGTMDDAIAAVRHLEAGHFEPIVGTVVPLSEIGEAQRLLESGAVLGKVVVKP